MNREKKVPLSTPTETIKTGLYVLVLLLIFVLSLNALNLNLVVFIYRFNSNFSRVFSSFMALEMAVVVPGLIQLVTTVAMAIAALFVGSLLSLILAFLAAENTTPHPILAASIKSLVAIIRAIPNLVLILMIVASLGLRPIAAVTSLTLSAIGYLTKAFATSIEQVPKNVEQTMSSIGANWLQTIIHGYLPSVSPSFIAWISIRFELSISDSITLGIIGAGGVGTMLSRALRNHNFGEVTTLLLLIFFAVIVIEFILSYVKKRFNT